MKKKGVIASLSPTSSSSLPQYLAKSMASFSDIEHVYPYQGKIRRYLIAVRTFHPKRQIWRDRFEKESEHRLSVWHDYSNQIQKSASLLKPDFILQEGLHFNAFPSAYSGGKFLYLHGTLSMLLDSPYECSMWIPPKDEIKQWLEQESVILSFADKILIGSNFLRKVLQKRYGVKESKIEFVGTGVPPFGQNYFDERSPRSGKTLLFVGKDFERKGGYILLEAFRLLKIEIPDARLLMVGPHKIDMKLPEGAKLIGRVTDREKLQSIFQKSDIFVMPTLHESFGFVFLEAMSFGLPCIGTRMFAIPEIIEDGITGLIIDTNNPLKLKDAMVHLINNPDKARIMGRIGADKVLTHFSWDLVGKRIASVCNI